MSKSIKTLVYEKYGKNLKIVPVKLCGHVMFYKLLDGKGKVISCGDKASVWVEALP